MPNQFIGRGRELNVASDMLDAATEGHGGVLVVTGEAGIGKSRFSRQIAQLARTRSMRAVWATGWPDGGAGPYWPWPEILAELDPSSAAALEADAAGAEAERFGRFRSARAALRRSAFLQPLVIALDDAHFIDADALLLTRFIARGVTGHRLLLLLTHRDAADVAPYAMPVLSEISREGRVVRLGGFAADDVADLLTARGEQADPAVARRVRDLTGGNPFLVEQVLDAGIHRRDVPLPEPVRRLLVARLDALDREVLEVLEAAAVLGPSASLGELLTVAAVDRHTLERARGAAAAAGVVRPDRSAAIAFVHELAREAVVARATPERLVTLHRHCLAALDADSTEHAVRRAHHALALARASAIDAPDAVDIVRSSARVLLAHGSPEAAVELLGEAFDAYDAPGRGNTSPLLTELGQALLATGRLADARLAFRRALAAGDDADAVGYAQVILGLGGVWVQEHRSAEDRRAYHDMVGHAIDRIVADGAQSASGLVASLRLRRAAERAVIGAGDVDEMSVALGAVRECGDPHRIADALSLVHHTMLGPEHAVDRILVATELLDVARSCDDELHTLMGLLWHTVDVLLLGHDSQRDLIELRTRADALGMRAILFVADAIDVMTVLRAGDMDGAERAMSECFQRGIEIGDPDASTYYAAHVLARSWYMGHAVELLDVAEQVAVSGEMPPENPVFTAVAAALAAEAGERDRSERALASLGRGRLDELLSGSCWLLTMFALVEAAVSLDDADLAEELYRLLVPFASLPMMGSLAMCCFGSTERSLGLAARVTGRFDEAVAHLERAEVENQRLGNWPLTAITRGELAATLRSRSAPGDRARAVTLVATALEGATRMGLDGRVRQLERLQESLNRRLPAMPTATCVRLGQVWDVVAGGERARVPDTVGMGYLAALLTAPGSEIPVGRLAGLDLVTAPQEVFDARALRELRQRMHDLEDAIDTATLQGNVGAVQRLQNELDQITDHLRVALGHDGQSRRFDDATERARTSVQKALRRAIGNIGREAPELAAALTASIVTGYRCCYSPVASAPERWTVSTH